MDTATNEANSYLQELDDACVCCVLSHLSSARDLVKVQASCKRLRNVGLTNKLWLKWLYADYGLNVAPVSAAATGSSCPAAGAAQRLYLQLQRKKAQHALHARAICTDGSCDEPYDAYWADNMFAYKRSVMYCSASDTTNIHVLARLSPQQQPLPPTPQQLTVVPQALTEEQRRAFLLDRCTRVAARLIRPDLFELYQQDIAQHGQQDIQQGQPVHRSSSGTGGPPGGQQQQQGGGFLGMLLRRITGSSADVERATAVRNVLNSCSTEGLVEFFLECFIAQAQNQAWAAPLYSGLDDDGLQLVRWMAFNEYERALEPRSQFRLLNHVLQQQSPPNTATSLSTSQPGGHSRPAWLIAAGAGGAAAVGARAVSRSSSTGQQQRQPQPKPRQLLCDEHQVQELLKTTSPQQNLCIIKECIFARDGIGGSTCPISCGVLYVGHYYNPTSPQSSSSSSMQAAHDEAVEGLQSAAELYGPAATPPAAVTMLSSMAQQPWVAASNDLTTALLVMIAAAAGQLPLVIDYACNRKAEWIEFQQPSLEQIREQLRSHHHQQQQQQEGAGNTGSSSSSNCVLCPVLWFRFNNTGPPDDDDDDDDDDDGEVQVMLELEEDLEDTWHMPLVAPAVRPAAPAAQAAGGGAAQGAAGAEHVEVAAAVREAHRQYQQVLKQQQQSRSGNAPPAPAAPLPPGRFNTTTAKAVAAARSALRSVEPREVPRSPTSDAVPELPVTACEVSAALGYLPTDEPLHQNYLAVQLQQPRAANFVCMKLLNCEDVKPGFNRERGGCNIDVQLAMLRGHELGPLPAGLAVVGVE